jgi:hypothetical protein
MENFAGDDSELFHISISAFDKRRSIAESQEREKHPTKSK